MIFIDLIISAVFALVSSRWGSDLDYYELLTAYESSKIPTGIVYWIHTIGVRFPSNYRYPAYLTRASADQDGLYFVTPLLWVPCQRIHIPWRDVEVRDQDTWDWKMEFFIPKLGVELVTHKSLVERLLKDGGQPVFRKA